MMNNQPVIQLNNGVELPALGFGVFQTPAESPRQRSRRPCASATGWSIRPPRTSTSARSARRSPPAGSRATDLFVQTKLWVSDYGYRQALHAFDVSTRKLGLDTSTCTSCTSRCPRFDGPTVGATRPPERLLDEGRVRAIGVSNLSAAHLEHFLPRLSMSCRPSTRSRSTPTTASPRCAPPRAARHRDPGVVAARRRLRLRAGRGRPKNALTDPVIAAIAEAHGKTPAQVLLRWHIDSGRSAIPKSVHAGAHRREPGRLRLLADSRRPRRHRRPRHRGPGWSDQDESTSGPSIGRSPSDCATLQARAQSANGASGFKAQQRRAAVS